jgi:hypothetical protein
MKKEWYYELQYRPFRHGNYPSSLKYGMPRHEIVPGFKRYGILIYTQPLPADVVKEYELIEVDSII